MPTYNAPSEGYRTSIPPGTAAFRRVVGQHFGFIRVEVVRDRGRCAQQASEHCVCRGIDFFTTDTAKGRRVFEFCVNNAEEMGVQSVIFNRRVWGFGQWFERFYGGPSPHTDHVHVGLNRWAAANLTDDMVRARLRPRPDEEDDMPFTENQLIDIMRRVRDEKPRIVSSVLGVVTGAGEELEVRLEPPPGRGYTWVSVVSPRAGKVHAGWVTVAGVVEGKDYDLTPHVPILIQTDRANVASFYIRNVTGHGPASAVAYTIEKG